MKSFARKIANMNIIELEMLIQDEALKLSNELLRLQAKNDYEEPPELEQKLQKIKTKEEMYEFCLKVVRNVIECLSGKENDE